MPFPVSAPVSASLLNLVLAAVLIPAPQEVRSTSADAARALAERLEGRAGHTFVAQVPGSTDEYVAAMKAGAMLLVVSARYEQPSLLNERIWRGDFEDAYRTLNTGSVREGKLFVQDMGADGLQWTRVEGGAYDMAYESVVNRIAFDGNWKAQQLSRGDYTERFRTLDGRYARLLQTLLAASDGTPAPETTRR